ncbi:MAG TPA: response regulator transcription factor [Acidimicrobiales bacterium]|nr:response regulator transcription factor [Acidimicrobiales bacterium]
MLVADSQRLFGEVLGTALDLEIDLEVIPHYPTRGRAALDAIRRHQPDVVIYDQWMLEVDGPAATRVVASFSPATKVLVLSWYHGPLQIQAALGAGAAGFLPKSLRLEELIEAVRRAAAGDPLVFGEELARLVESIDDRWQGGVELEERFGSLSPREIQVLRALAGAAAPPQIAEALGISIGTVKNHIHHILAKTATSSQLEVVSLARLFGFVVDSRLRLPISPRPPSPAPVKSGAAGSPRPPPASGGTCSVMVADTERLFAEALGRCLGQETDLAVVATFPVSGLAAVDAILRHRPDVVLYDLWLRGLQGAAAVRALREWSPATKAVLSTWFHGRPQIRRALAGRPVSMVPKTSALSGVVDAVRAAHARPLEQHWAELLEIVEILREGETPPDERLDRLLTLSPRELELLHQLALGGPAKRIAQEMSLAVGTVKNSIHQLLAKTGARNQTEAVAMAREHGFLD